MTLYHLEFDKCMFAGLSIGDFFSKSLILGVDTLHQIFLSQFFLVFSLRMHVTNFCVVRQGFVSPILWYFCWVFVFFFYYQIIRKRWLYRLGVLSSQIFSPHTCVFMALQVGLSGSSILSISFMGQTRLRHQMVTRFIIPTLSYSPTSTWKINSSTTKQGYQLSHSLWSLLGGYLTVIQRHWNWFFFVKVT